jgi:hypothetical protein
LQNCPITHEDIKIAHDIYGADIANIRGKRTRRKPERVDTDYEEIPRALSLSHTNVTLVVDFIFVNKVPFLLSALHNINLITIEHAPKRTTSKLGHLLLRIVNVYARAGLCVCAILMDNEFEKVREHLPSVDMNTPVAAEHIAEIERRIRYIKERARGILSTLPYPALLNLMPIQLLHFVMMWLNNFPSATSISPQYSPRELILRHCLDYKKHFHAPFGAYCKAH